MKKKKPTATPDVLAWRWRMVKACGTMQEFCRKTKRDQSQVSEWLSGTKVPGDDSKAAMEKDLKKLGV